MEVVNHKLDVAEQCPAADIRGTITPEAIVVHYTAGGSAKSSKDWLTREDDSYVSAHLVIARNGHIFQLVPFNRKALHAGVSSWEGRSDLNNWSIGIELANWGIVSRNGNSFVSWSGQPVQSILVKQAVHKSGLSAYWETYPGAQIASLIDVCLLLKSTYDIQTIVGHDDVAPARKLDPGPLLDIKELREEVTRLSTDFVSVADTEIDELDLFEMALSQACLKHHILRDALIGVNRRVNKEIQDG